MSLESRFLWLAQETMPRLSTLSRGTGEIEHSSSQRVSVRLEPKDFSNPVPRRPPRGILKHEGSYTPTVNYMPPPGLYQHRHTRMKREATLPKTYSTKKGALVLYSEEFADFHNNTLPKDSRHCELDRQLDVRTTDLTLAISRFEQSQNKYNRFVRRNNFPEIKPGHSARRHVAAWHMSHPAVNLHGALGSRLAMKPDKRGRKKRIIRTSLTVFPPPYNLPSTLNQTRHGPQVSGGVLKGRAVHAVKPPFVQTTKATSFSSPFGPNKKLENSKEWTHPVRIEHETEDMSSASSDIKFTRNRLPPIFKNPPSEGGRIKDGGSSRHTSVTSGSLRKTVRIQLEPVFLPDAGSPQSDSRPR